MHVTNFEMTDILTDLDASIFFVSYALAEPVTNVLLKRLTPRVFFTGIILMWGLTMALMGLVTNYAGLLVRLRTEYLFEGSRARLTEYQACRFILGLTEAGLFPGANYYM